MRIARRETAKGGILPKKRESSRRYHLGRTAQVQEKRGVAPKIYRGGETVLYLREGGLGLYLMNDIPAGGAAR